MQRIRPMIQPIWTNVTLPRYAVASIASTLYPRLRSLASTTGSNTVHVKAGGLAGDVTSFWTDGRHALEISTDWPYWDDFRSNKFGSMVNFTEFQACTQCIPRSLMLEHAGTLHRSLFRVEATHSNAGEDTGPLDSAQLRWQNGKFAIGQMMLNRFS